MVQLQKHLNEIKETRKQINATNSPQRKYELGRHLNKLEKEYRIARYNIARSRNGEATN